MPAAARNDVLVVAFLILFYAAGVICLPTIVANDHLIAKRVNNASGSRVTGRTMAYVAEEHLASDLVPRYIRPTRLRYHHAVAFILAVWYVQLLEHCLAFTKSEINVRQRILLHCSTSY